MRFRFPILFITILLCLSWIPISHAQDDIWRGWLYEETEGRMTLINSEQQVLDNFILPKPAGFEAYLYPYNVAVSRNGERVAYVLSSLEEARVLVVYHLVNKNIITQYDLAAPQEGIYTGTSLSYIAQPEIFSADGRFLAFSYFYNENWALLVFDLDVNGALIQSLTSNMVNLPTYQGITIAPVPVFFDFNTVHVVFAPVGGDGYYTLDSFEWDYLFNTFTQSNIFRGLAYDIEPRTGEVIFPYLDVKFPDRTAEIIGMGVHQNTVQVFSPSVLDAPFPFYSDQNNVINDAHFIQNGERVLMSLYPVVGEGSNQVYLVTDRSGAIQGILPHQGVFVSNIFNVRDGVVFNMTTSEAATYFSFMQGMDTSTVIFVDTVNFPVGTNTGISLYIGDTGKYPRLVWVRDTVNTVAPNPNTWTMLTAPIANNPSNNPPALPPQQPPQQPPVTTSITPTPSSGIFVGGQARVTTQVEVLNVRNNPSTSATKLNELPPLTIVSVVGGPQYAQGYTWWQISIGTLTGWVAAGTGNQVWLEPFTGSTSLPPPPPPVVTTTLPAPLLYDPQPFQVFTLAEINPPGSGTIINIALEWETLVGAKNYFVQVELCDSNGDNCQSIYGGFYDFPTYFFNVTQFGYGIYRWRAYGIDMQGNQGTPSDWRYFTYRMS